MPRFIRAYDNHNEPLINANDDFLPRTYFNIVRLKKGKRSTPACPAMKPAGC